MISFPRAVDRPRDLPELRAALVEMTKPNGVWAQAEFEKLLMELTGGDTGWHRDVRGQWFMAGPKGYSEDELSEKLNSAALHADNNVRWYREYLGDAQLIHIDDKMCDFLVAAAEAVPTDLRLTLHDAPCPVGLVVFAKPMIGTDSGSFDGVVQEGKGGAQSRAGEPVRVDGIMWAPVHLPSADLPWYADIPADDPGVDGVSIASFRMMAPEHDDPAALSGPRFDQVIWLPLGRSDWLWDQPLHEMVGARPDPKHDFQQLSMLEDRRLLAAIWATLNQRRLIDTEIVLPDRAARKRLVRAGHDPDQQVQLIHLRKSEYRMLDQTETTGRKLRFRVPVRPYYKRQPYGPGRKLRKMILVPRHWRGPDDAPIRHIERVWEVDR